MNEATALSRAFVESHPGDAARVLEGLPAAAAADWLSTIPARLAVPVVRSMLPLFVARLLDQLPDERAATLLAGLGPQAGVPALRLLDAARGDTLLALLPLPRALGFRLLLGYPGNTAGGWADPQVVAVDPEHTAAEALDRVRALGSGIEIDDIYLCDRAQRLIGRVPLATLLRAEAATPVRRLSQPVTAQVPAQALLSAVAEHPGWVEHRALPVIERGGRLAGLLRRTALERALAADSRHAALPRPADAMSLLATGYWASVAELIELCVSWLPTPAPPAGPPPP